LIITRHYFFSHIGKAIQMDIESNLPPNQDQKKYIQDEERSQGKQAFEQGEGQGGGTENEEGALQESSNKGYDEDQPGHPVRSTGSLRKDQESGSVQPGDVNREGKI